MKYLKRCSCFFVLFTLFVSCNKPFVPGKHQIAFISLFNKELPLPLKIDSTFIVAPDTLEALSLHELEGIKNDSLYAETASGLVTSINACLFIEKLKQQNKYQSYLDSIDVGMVKNAMAFKIGKINLENKRCMILWGISEGSFEADPGYSGVSIIASYANNTDGFIHFVIGQQYNAGDPPSFLEQKTASEITNKQLKITSVTLSEERSAGTKTSETKFLKIELKHGEVKTLMKINGNRH